MSDKLRFSHPCSDPLDQQVLKEIFESGQLNFGPHTVSAEKKLANYTGIDNIALVSSGTTALQLSLLSYGLQPGDQVLIPSYSFAATANAVTSLGLRPLFIDCQENGSGLDLNQLHDLLDQNISFKAVIAVHLFGHPFAQSDLLDFLTDQNIPLIEDSAQWFASEKQRSGFSKNYLTCFSFDPTKTLHSCGPLGAIASDNASLIETVRSLRNQGKKKLDGFLGTGFNAKPGEIRSAYLCQQLDRFSSIEEKRMNIVSAYQKYCDIHSITFLKPQLKESRSTWQKFVIQHDDLELVQRRLDEAGIPWQQHYPYILPQVIGDKNIDDGRFPNAFQLRKQSLSLPLHPYIEESEVELICKTVAQRI